MTAKVYRLCVEYELYVLAEDENDAEWSLDAVLLENDGGPDVLVASEVTSLDEVPMGWHHNYPFDPLAIGDDLTIAQILEPEGRPEADSGPTEADLEAARLQGALPL